jgi:hypothetical protein
MTKHTSTDSTELARELLATINANAAKDALLLQEQLDLESSGIIASEDPPAAAQVEAAKAQWLNGYAPPPVVPAANRLHEIQVSRAGLKAAEADLHRHLFAASADAYRAWSARMRSGGTRYSSAV